MKEGIKKSILNILALDETIDKTRIETALDYLDGRDIPPADETKPQPGQLLAASGKIIKCKDVAKMLGVTPQCLRNWRKRANGLKPYIAPGSSRAAGYLEGDVLDFVRRSTGGVTPCAV